MRKIKILIILISFFSCKEETKINSNKKDIKPIQFDTTFNNNTISKKIIDSNYVILFKIKEKYGIINEVFDCHFQDKLKPYYSDTNCIQFICRASGGSYEFYQCELTGNKISVGYFNTFYYPYKQFETNFKVYAFKKEIDNKKIYFKGNFNSDSKIIENPNIEKSLLLPKEFWDIGILHFIMYPKEIEIEFENHITIKLKHNL